MAIPTKDISLSSIIIFFPAALGKVSVVIIDFAAFSHLFSSVFKETEMALFVGLIGIFSPITPVEQIKISFSLHLIIFFIFEEIDLLIFLPFLPVKALAKPALTARTLADPSMIFFLQNSTGSALISD